MRLIDADELLKKTAHWKDICTSDTSIRMIDAFEKGISEVKTISAIPVDVLRSLFVKRMTVDSETKDRSMCLEVDIAKELQDGNRADG